MMKPVPEAAIDGRTPLARWLRELVRLQPSGDVFAGLERRIQTADPSPSPCR